MLRTTAFCCPRRMHVIQSMPRSLDLPDTLSCLKYAVPTDDDKQRLPVTKPTSVPLQKHSCSPTWPIMLSALKYTSWAVEYCVCPLMSTVAPMCVQMLKGQEKKFFVF